MLTKTPESMRLSLRVLAHLLAYPDAELRARTEDLLDALRLEQALGAARLLELEALCRQLATMDPYELEARYVDTFDRGRRTSLHLFEHVHGDSRDRGPALVDLWQTYERAGLAFDARELPDHLGVVLEFASTQPPEVARDFLGEVSHILNALFSALESRESPYASVIAAVLELAGERVQPVAIAPEPELDESWEEPPAFDGCNVPGQPAGGRSGAARREPMRFVYEARRDRRAGAGTQGAPK